MDSIDKIKQESRQLRVEMRQKTIGYILAGFGVVAGLAWNEAIKAFIEYVFPMGQNTLLAKFVYAFLITLIVVLATVYLMRLIQSDNANNQKT